MNRHSEIHKLKHWVKFWPSTSSALSDRLLDFKVQHLWRNTNILRKNMAHAPLRLTRYFWNTTVGILNNAGAVYWMLNYWMLKFSFYIRSKVFIVIYERHKHWFANIFVEWRKMTDVCTCTWCMLLVCFRIYSLQSIPTILYRIMAI